jgi:CRISPR system Cascade subunit CasE
MTLHMVQLAAEPRWLAAWSRVAGVPGDDEGYLVHAALRAAFGALAPQPFAVLGGDPGRPLKVLGYGLADEASLRAVLETPREPLLAKLFAPDAIHSKAMPASFPLGAAYAFELRACPIVRTKRGDGSGSRELDVFLHRGLAAPDEPLSREAVYADWLRATLAEGGAGVSGVAVHRLDQAPLVRRASGRARRLPGARRPDVTFRGTLTVTDPDLFAVLLARGVGRHRAFGYGMLLLRPAGAV